MKISGASFGKISKLSSDFSSKNWIHVNGFNYPSRIHCDGFMCWCRLYSRIWAVQGDVLKVWGCVDYVWTVFRLFKHTILIPSFSNEFKRCMSPWILSVDTYYDILGWETRTMAFRTKSPKWTEERRRLFACKNETRTKLPKLTFKKKSNVPDDFNWQSWSHFEWIQLSKSNPLGWIQVFKRNRMFNPANF